MANHHSFFASLMTLWRHFVMPFFD